MVNKIRWQHNQPTNPKNRTHAFIQGSISQERKSRSQECKKWRLILWSLSSVVAIKCRDLPGESNVFSLSSLLCHRPELLKFKLLNWTLDLKYKLLYCFAFNQLYILMYPYLQRATFTENTCTKTIVIRIKINVATAASYAERDGICYWAVPTPPHSARHTAHCCCCTPLHCTALHCTALHPALHTPHLWSPRQHYT